jgi:hypothetical protein
VSSSTPTGLAVAATPRLQLTTCNHDVRIKKPELASGFFIALYIGKFHLLKAVFSQSDSIFVFYALCTSILHIFWAEYGHNNNLTSLDSLRIR